MANYRKAILITYPIEQVINEAISLADAAGYSVIKTVTPRQITKSRFGIGRGKAEEVKEIVKEIKPSGIRAAICNGRVGATAAASISTPKAKAAQTSSLELTRPRAPAASAPSTEPMPIAVVSSA